MPDNFVREKRERRVETVGFFDQGVGLVYN